jgi:hypothetical protein
LFPAGANAGTHSSLVPIAKWFCTHYVNGLLRRSGESELSRRAKAIHIIKIGLAWAVMCFLILGPPLHGAGRFVKTLSAF